MTTPTSDTLTTAHDDRARERRSVWIVWAILVAVTLTGWLLTDEAGAGNAIVALVVLFGLAKCWLIVQHYMEVRHAPRWLQIVTTAWMVILWSTLLALFVRA